MAGRGPSTVGDAERNAGLRVYPRSIFLCPEPDERPHMARTMTTPTPRESLKGSAAAVALVATGSKLLTACASTRNASAPAPQKMLILGGTGFLGPAIVESARSRGHV